MSNIIINQQANIQVIHVGDSQTPVMIIDDFALDTTELINHSCLDVVFNHVEDSYYPGIRAFLPREYVITVLQAIYQKICDVYQIPEALNLKPLDVYLSLITIKEQDLHLLQRIPHFDSTQPFYFAILHYLNDKPHGNTGFFRHKPTRFEKITDHNVDEYLASSSAFINSQKELPDQYCTQSNDHYELYHEIEYKPNRLVIYPGNLLHTSLVNTEQDIDGNPKTGRLTANLFIEFQ